MDRLSNRSNYQSQQQSYQGNQLKTAPETPENSSFKNGAGGLPKNLMLSRGFSRVQANQDMVNETRAQIENNLGVHNDDKQRLSLTTTNTTTNNDNNSVPGKQIQSQTNKSSLSKKLLNNELTCYSFMLPDLNKYSDYKLKEYLQNELIELPAQYNLTESGHLNWWTQNNWENVCRPLYPMVTSGDGNCLLHAASLAMWGLHDRYLILRKALHSTLKEIKEDNTSPLWRRWKWEQMCQNKKYGLIYDEDEWAREWQSLLKLSSYQPRCQINNNNASTRSTNALPLNSNDLVNSSSSSSVSSHVNKTVTNSNQNGTQSNQNQNQNQPQQDGTCYFESLEEFHVFLLAHILNRPIIIVSDTMLHDLNGEPLSPIPFGGIYLPFECDLNKCHRYPLVLAYDSAHFSALVLMDDEDIEEEDDHHYNSNSTAPNQHRHDEDTDTEEEIDEEDLSHQIDTDENHDLASFYPKHTKEKKLTNEQINQLNKKLQTKPPYSIIPLTYSNKELLPLHFAHDPGPNYDWSNFPHEEQLKIKATNLTSSANSSDHSLKDEVSVNSFNKRNTANGANSADKSTSPVSSEQAIPELTKSQKMFLIQKYLDVVKLELFDPGPLGKRNGSNYAYNSSGLCATINNVQVPEPIETLTKLSGNSPSIENGFSKNTKQNSKSQNKLQKFFNLFKRNNEPSNGQFKVKSIKQDSDQQLTLFNGGKLRKSIKNLSDFASSRKSPELTSSSSAAGISINPSNTQSTNRIDLPQLNNNNNSNFTSSKTLPTKLKSNSSSSTQSINPSINGTSRAIITPRYLHFHKLVTFKSWSYLFDSMNHHACMLGVKLNLAKLPKFNKIIFNYIESTKHKLELIKQQQKAQVLQQQQLQHQMIMQQRMNQANNMNGSHLRRPVHVCRASRLDCSIDNPCNFCYNNNIHLSENIILKNNLARSNQLNGNIYNQYSYNNNNINGNNRREYAYKNNDKIYEDEITAFHHI